MDYGRRAIKVLYQPPSPRPGWLSFSYELVKKTLLGGQILMCALLCRRSA